MAVGVGATMLFHFDLVYAAPNAQFSLPFVNLGLVPEAGSSLLAPAIFGHAKASALLLLGEPLRAEHAERAGFVTEIVAENLFEHARSKARILGSKSPSSLQNTRRLLKGDSEALNRRIALEMELFGSALESCEAREAFAAFFEKRTPNFAVHGG
jgi:enoyl-CoA hydratase/carnithine racemase